MTQASYTVAGFRQNRAVASVRWTRRVKREPRINYYAFHPKTMMALALSCSLVGILLFSVGFLLGVGVSLPESPLYAFKRDARMAAVADLPASVPVILTLPPSPAPPRDVPAESLPEPEAAVPVPSPEPAASAAVPQEEAPPASGPEAVSQPVAPPAEQAPPMAFSVQVGAFLLEKEANSVVEELQQKGYTPYIATAWGDWNGKRRLWHQVQIGDYADREQASLAAAGFSAAEKMLAIVRRVNPL